VVINDVGGKSTAAVGSATVLGTTLSGTGTSFTAVEGTASSVTVATFTDANPNAPTSDFSGTIVWGDGQSSTFGPGNVTFVSKTSTTATFSVSATHAYLEEGIYNTANKNAVTVTINDVHGASTTATSSATVNDAPLNSTGSPQTISTTPTGAPIVEGSSTGSIAVATFQDADTSEPDADTFPGADYSATIAWGDGTSSTGIIQPLAPSLGLFQVFGSHVYTEDGSFNPIVTIRDLGGAPTINATNTTITVADAPLSGDISPGASTIKATTGVNTGTVTVGKFTDADPNGGSGTGPQPDYQAVIYWGDGTSSTVSSNFVRGAVSSAGVVISVTGNHTYTAAGTYTIFILVTDTDGVPASPGSRSTAFILDTTVIVTS
jgi:hypothetical protein